MIKYFRSISLIFTGLVIGISVIFAIIGLVGRMIVFIIPFTLIVLFLGVPFYYIWKSRLRTNGESSSINISKAFTLLISGSVAIGIPILFAVGKIENIEYQPIIALTTWLLNAVIFVYAVYSNPLYLSGNLINSKSKGSDQFSPIFNKYFSKKVGSKVKIIAISIVILISLILAVFYFSPSKAKLVFYDEINLDIRPFDETYWNSSENLVKFPNGKINNINLYFLESNEAFSINGRFYYFMKGSVCNECDGGWIHFVYSPDFLSTSWVDRRGFSHDYFEIPFSGIEFDSYEYSPLIKYCDRSQMPLPSCKSYLLSLNPLDSDIENLQLLKEIAILTKDEYESIPAENSEIYYGQIFEDTYGVISYTTLFDHSATLSNNCPPECSLNTRLISIDPGSGQMKIEEHDGYLYRRLELVKQFKDNRCKKMRQFKEVRDFYDY
jgi:hypothetical protein